MLKKILRKIWHIAPNQAFREECWRHDAWMIDEYQLPELTDEEVALFQKTWPCFSSVDRRDLTYLRMYKHAYGFNPYFLPDFQFYEYIIKRTNPLNMVTPFVNKAMYDVYLPQLPIPKTVTKAISGIKYDGKSRRIDEDMEVALLCKQDKFIIKPSIESGCGKGVQKIILDNIDDKENYLRELIHKYGEDYITQEVIEQHPVIGKLNPTSLNTCRVTTLFFNGKMSSSTILKVGKQNADKDNWQTSYVIGVSGGSVSIMDLTRN